MMNFTLPFIILNFFMALWVTHSFAAPVIVYQDHPILNNRTITVDTYYNDTDFDGYHTIIYSSRQPQNLFLHEINWQAIHIIHSWAKAWITQKINELLMNQCQEYCQRAFSTASSLYSFSEEESEKY